MTPAGWTITVLYTTIMLLFMGGLIGIKHREGKEPDASDFFMALIWPASMLLIIGYAMTQAQSEDE